ncbi:MAG: methyl-accepting chemotaxis protein [Methylococcales bacterium]|nr:methyl-accepting chemotaxis protein [Methylococcales bacterium]
MFKSMTLGTKLVTSFITVATIGLIVCVIGIFNMNRLDHYVDKVYSKDLLGLSYVKEAQSTRLRAARDWRSALLATTIEEKRKAVESVKKNVQSYKESIHKGGDLFDDEKYKVLVREIYDATPEWERLTLQVTSMIVEQNLMQQTPELAVILKAQQPLAKIIDGNISKLTEAKELTSEETAKESSELYSLNFVVMTVLVTLGFISSVAIGMLFSRYLTKQLGGELTDAINGVKTLSAGDFSGKLNLKKGDTSSLLYTLRVMQDTITSFIDAQRSMAKKHHDGFLSEKIDATKFQGTYREMAQEINELVQSHIAVKMQIVDVVTQYAQGNFEPDFERLPAEKAKVTAAIDAVKASLLEINSEIHMLATAGAQGNFSKRSDASRFKFMFRDMLSQLNNLMESCDTGFNDVLRIANALAQGDLTQKITNDYLGTFGKTQDAMNDTVEHLKSLVGEIKESSDSITTAAQEIASGNSDLSHRTEEQAASLEKTARSMQDFTLIVQKNSDNAKCANEMALTSSDIARRGVTVVAKVVTTMEDINESSRKIVDIISVIDSIAFQTNILALNAAVEAARAGEQGRGFAVVATEVRNLAQRAAIAAGEIKSLISDSVEKVEDGTKLVAIAGKTMEEIVSSIQSVSATISAITTASHEQNEEIQQVNFAIRQMDEVTQQNATLVEHAAATAESLEEQTLKLTHSVGNFKMNSFLFAA